LAWLIIAPSFGPVLLDPWRIGAALAFGAGGIIALIIRARRIVTLVVAALVIIALIVIALVVVPLIVKTLTIPALMIMTLPVIPLVIVPLAVLGAAVILVARGALVLTTVLAPILARLALAGFGGFNQACLVIADHFDHIMACDIGLIIAALIAVVRPILALPTLARLAVLSTAWLTILGIGLLAAFLFGGKLAVGFGQKPCVMFCVLQKILSGNAVVGQLRITGKKLVFFDQLGRGATHLAIGA
jgi:hypothetical protein